MQHKNSDTLKKLVIDRGASVTITGSSADFMLASRWLGAQPRRQP